MSIPDTETTPPPAPDDAPATNLLLDSLEIKNFRAFRHLTIPKLGRVNLITGKNNVGKSSVLEAIRLYARRNPFLLLRNLLLSRSELRPITLTSRYDAREEAQQLFLTGDLLTTLNNTISVNSLFYGRPELASLKRFANDISISPYGANEKIILKIFISWMDPFTGETKEVGNTYSNLDKRENLPQLNEFTPQLFASFGNYTGVVGVDALMKGGSDFASRAVTPLSGCLYIPVEGLSSYEAGAFWDKIALTDREQEIVNALSLIINDLQRINLIGDERGAENTGRVPMLKLSRFDKPVPLKSLGDGANRLFTLTLVLSNAGNGILLVDEIENGLHYSALPDVWRLIFQTAKRLNVQVFATTHSWDCIEAFQKAASEDDDPNSGVLVRLQREDDGDVTATVFDEEYLAIVTRSGIEVR